MSRRTFGTVRYRDDRMAFFIQFTWLGRQHQRRICSATGKEDLVARHRAEEALRRIETGLETGKPLKVVLNEVLGEVTGHRLRFRDAAPMYLAYAEARKKPSTFTGDISRLRVLCKAGWAGKYLAQITSADLTRWSSQRTSGRNKVSGATVNRDLNLASALFKWAIRMGYLDVNPVKTVEPYSEKGRERVHWLTVPEIDILLEAADPAFRPALLCLFDTGMRTTELMELRWPSVDLERGVVIVEPGTAKSGRERHIPLTTRLSAELRRLGQLRKSTRGHVFCRPGGKPWSYDTLRRRLHWCLRDSEGLDPARAAKTTLHTTRHTFASHLAQQGVSFQEIAYLLGHSLSLIHI